MQTTIGRSKTGTPTVHECGGGATNTGSAEIICGPYGEKLQPFFKPRKGYCNEPHAVFVAKAGQYLIDNWRNREGDHIKVYVITRIGSAQDPNSLVTEKVAEWENGDGNIPSFLEPAVKAAREKASCYHCRESHYSL